MPIIDKITALGAGATETILKPVQEDIRILAVECYNLTRVDYALVYLRDPTAQVSLRIVRGQQEAAGIGPAWHGDLPWEQQYVLVAEFLQHTAGDLIRIKVLWE